MGKNVIRSIRKGSAQWSEEDRLQLVSILAKAGYAVKIGRRIVPGTENKSKPQMEYTVEYWESEVQMKIGEVVEILSREKDNYSFGDYRYEAIMNACRILEKLPRSEEADTYEPIPN